MPAGFQAGDLLVAGLATRGNTTDISTPAGWTKPIASATSGQSALFYRYATGGDSAPTFTNDGVEVAGWIAAFRSAKNAPVHSAADQSSICAAFDVPALTVDSPNCLVISFARRHLPSEWAGGSVSAIQPSGFTLIAQRPTAVQFENVLGFAYQIQTTAHSFASDEAVWTPSPAPGSSDCSCAALVFLAAAAGIRTPVSGPLALGLVA